MYQVVTREHVEALLAAEPPVGSRTIAAGFTANPDLLLDGGPALMARIEQWRAASPPAEAAVWRAILDAQHQAASGRGADLTVEPAAALCRLDAYGHAHTVGGTGVRAAAQAARLGQRAIVSIPAADPRITALLAWPLLTLVPASSHGAARLPLHYIIELPAAAPSGAAQAQPGRANRLIVHGEEAWHPLFPDAFMEPLAASKPPVRLLLLSGFNIYTDEPALGRALDHAGRWLEAVRQRVPDLWIYLEMAGYTLPAAPGRVLAELGPHVDAVGMNEDECTGAAGLTGAIGDLPPDGQIALMRQTMERYALHRLVVHAAWASGYMAPTPLPARERRSAARALALGNTAAGFRFARGYDGTLRDLRHAAQTWTLARAGVECAAAVAGHPDLVVIPAWHLPAGVGTIGLGDAFTGAFLTGLDPPVPSVPVESRQA